MYSFTPCLRIVLLVAMVLVFVEGGFEGFLCPDPEKCRVDCIANHNSVHGFCGNATEGDFNCYCSLSRSKKARMLPEVKKRNFQCKDKLDGRYDVVCRLDCQCNHAALDAKCNFEQQYCECLIGNPRPKRIAPCPFKSALEGNTFINNLKIPNFPVFIGGTSDVVE